MSTVLKLFYSPARGDNFTASTTQGELDAINAGYFYVRNEGYVYPSSQPNTVPLNLYWNPSRGDNFSAATPQGQQDALAAGYQFVRSEGYVYATQEPGTAPLKLFWSPVREDNFTTATAQGEQDAIAAGYQYVRDEGYVSPRPGAIDIDLDSNLGANHYMTTHGVLLLDTGHIDASTRTRTLTWFGGFTGAVQIVLEDANGYPIGWTSTQQFGVDGTWIGRSDRTDYWSEDLDPAMTKRAAAIHVFHFWDPSFAKFQQALDSAIANGKKIVDLIKEAKSLGGDGK
jgi:hypothetical protein